MNTEAQEVRPQRDTGEITSKNFLNMKTIEFPLSDKQLEALDILEKDESLELVFGGGARGGKTWLGSSWISKSCIDYPGSAWLIGREELKSLKRTTLRTFFTVLREMNLQRNVHYKFNATDMVLEFKNGSVVFFSELREIPSDPEFDRLGSFDLTGYWIDESQEVSKNAKDTLRARLTLLSGKCADGSDWVTWGKSLYTCNPGKNWIYSEFWKPLIKEKNQAQISGRYFITSLYVDNPNIDHQKYRDNVLRTDNKIKIERLLYGNFEYDETPGRLCDYDAICDIFGRNMPKGKLYMTVDVASEGDDKSVVMIWNEWKVSAIYVFDTNTIPELEAFIKEKSNKYLIPMDHIVVDAVSIGTGLWQSLSCHGFVGNRSAIQPPQAKVNTQHKLNYASLNSQCSHMLAMKINAKELGVLKTRYEEDIKEELDLIIQIDVDKDKPMKVLPKDEIKKKIGRSPDFKDAMMMRMYFELVEDDKKNTEQANRDIMDAMDDLIYS